MGVQKFRSIEQMNQAPVPIAAGNAFERFLRHCAATGSWLHALIRGACSDFGPSKKLRPPAIASGSIRARGGGSDLRTYLLVSEDS